MWRNSCSSTSLFSRFVMSNLLKSIKLNSEAYARAILSLSKASKTHSHYITFHFLGIILPHNVCSEQTCEVIQGFVYLTRINKLEKIYSVWFVLLKHEWPNQATENLAVKQELHYVQYNELNMWDRTPITSLRYPPHTDKQKNLLDLNVEDLIKFSKSLFLSFFFFSFVMGENENRFKLEKKNNNNIRYHSFCNKGRYFLL